MSPELVDILVKIAVGVAVSLVTTFVIPAITKWYSNLKDSKLKAFIDNAVDAAEQIYGPRTAKLKKQYVLDMVKSKFKKIGVSEETLDMLIEASVSRVSSAVKQAKEVAAISASATVSSLGSTTATETKNGLIVAKQESKTYKSDGDSSVTLS